MTTRFWCDPIRTAGMLNSDSALEWMRRMQARTAKELALPIVSMRAGRALERGMQLMRQHRLEGLPMAGDGQKVDKMALREALEQKL